jgi:putative holliday junction resolvase
LRTLAIDLGTRRVGLALSDEGGRLATPLEVLGITDPSQAFAPILDVVAQQGVGRIVVGLPLNMDDTVGPQARQAMAFGRELARRCGLEVLWVDERLSSFQAERDLADRKRAGEHLTRKKKKRQLDALAAAAFLQDFLDGRLKPVSA